MVNSYFIRIDLILFSNFVHGVNYTIIIQLLILIGMYYDCTRDHWNPFSIYSLSKYVSVIR